MRCTTQTRQHLQFEQLHPRHTTSLTNYFLAYYRLRYGGLHRPDLGTVDPFADNVQGRGQDFPHPTCIRSPGGLYQWGGLEHCHLLECFSGSPRFGSLQCTDIPTRQAILDLFPFPPCSRHTAPLRSNACLPYFLCGVQQYGGGSGGSATELACHGTQFHQ